MTDVAMAAKQLKRNKADVMCGISSDSFIFSSVVLFEKLAVLFTFMMQTGSVPNSLCASDVIPIPKNAKMSLSDSCNYRSLAVGSVLLKLLDIIILKKYQHVFSTSDLQFGFKENHSTVQCAARNYLLFYY